MKAKLVYVSFITRILVDDNATEEDILDAAKNEFYIKVKNELSENLDKIIDDTECPFGTFDTDK